MTSVGLRDEPRVMQNISGAFFDVRTVTDTVDLTKQGSRHSQHRPPNSYLCTYEKANNSTQYLESLECRERDERQPSNHSQHHHIIRISPPSPIAKIPSSFINRSSRPQQRRVDHKMKRPQDGILEVEINDRSFLLRTYVRPRSNITLLVSHFTVACHFGDQAA